MSSKRQQIGRRRFIQAVPAAVAASVALPSLVPSIAPAFSPAAQGGRGATPPKFGKDALKGAEEVDRFSHVRRRGRGGAPRGKPQPRQLR